MNGDARDKNSFIKIVFSWSYLCVVIIVSLHASSECFSNISCYFPCISAAPCFASRQVALDLAIVLVNSDAGTVGDHKHSNRRVGSYIKKSKQKNEGHFFN